VKYSKGDLVKLSDFGKLIAGDNEYNIGVIVDGPYNLLTPLGAETTTYYEAYDVLVGDEVMKRVPTEFLHRMTEYEENTERVEKMDNGDEAH